MDEPDAVARVLDVIAEAALELISYQVKAGAHAVGIGDSFCSQIGPRLYRDLALPREKLMVDQIHALGAVAKLHICGNTAPILQDMIATGADIIDVDHLVPTLAPFAGMLGPGRVFSGKADPVSVVQDGAPKDIERTVREDFVDAKGRLMCPRGARRRRRQHTRLQGRRRPPAGPGLSQAGCFAPYLRLVLEIQHQPPQVELVRRGLLPCFCHG
jgi:uroporphyrinogen decarboxylase